MIRKQEATGKTVDEARAKACAKASTEAQVWPQSRRHSNR